MALFAGYYEPMLIGGLQKNSFIDFPGHIAAVVFTAGCNFRCPYCHNPELIKPGENLLPAEELFEFLEKRRGKLQGVVVSGGEPTIFPDLPDFCSKIKAMGFALKLDTNGSNPGMLAGLVADGLVDYVAMDLKADPQVYPPDLAPGFSKDCDSLGALLLESMSVLAASGLPCEFRTTCAAPFISLQSMEKIAACIARLAPQIPLWLQRVNWENALQPAYPGAGQEENIECLRQCALAHIKQCEIR